jgi:hypothetical protein
MQLFYVICLSLSSSVVIVNTVWCNGKWRNGVIGLKVWVWVMVFNTTFNNISAISWQSILLEDFGAHGDVSSTQHYEIKFVSDLRHVSGFLRVLRFPPLIKLTATL